MGTAIQAYSICGFALHKELDQDSLIIRNDLDKPVVIICDGHGDKKGRDFAGVIGRIGMQSIPGDYEITKEYAEIIADNFKRNIVEQYGELWQKYTKCGATFLMVIFSGDYRRYIVVKLGDSYVMNVPVNFEGDGSRLPYDTVDIDGNVVNTMDPCIIWREFNKLGKEEKDDLGEGIKWVNYCKRRFGCAFGALGKFFRRENVGIATMGVEPELVMPDEDLRRCLDAFLRYDCLEVPEGSYVVVASDGLPIHKEKMWEQLRIGNLCSWIKQEYVLKGKEIDDCTAVVVFPS